MPPCSTANRFGGAFCRSPRERNRRKYGLGGHFAAIMSKAGISGKIRLHWAGGRALLSLSFHSLRHSMRSAMANARVSQEIRQKLTGHSSAEMRLPQSGFGKQGVRN